MENLPIRHALPEMGIAITRRKTTVFGPLSMVYGLYIDRKMIITYGLFHLLHAWFSPVWPILDWVLNMTCSHISSRLSSGGRKGREFSGIGCLFHLYRLSGTSCVIAGCYSALQWQKCPTYDLHDSFA